MVTKIIFALVFVAWVGEWPLQYDTVTYGGLWRSPFVVFAPLFTPIPGISLFPWQLLLIVFAAFCFGPINSQYHAPEMDRAIIISIVCVAITLLWGLARSGSFYFAYFQLWRYLAALLIAYMLMSTLRTERDLITLGKIVIFAALVRATLCIYHFWAHLYGKVDPLPQYVISHDDSMLFVLAIQISWAWAIIKGGKGAWRLAILVSLIVLYAMVLNDRRLAWVELVLPLPLVYALIGAGPLRKKVNRLAMIFGPLVLAYWIGGTVSDSAIFAPVHALSTAGSYADASSLTREEEIRNLLRTLVDSGNPILGTGWGQPYNKVESFYSNYHSEWVLVLYTPHNAIVGLAAFSGLVGFFGMLGVIPTATYLSARGYGRSSGNSVIQTAAICAICAVSIYVVQCYGDIGLQSFPGAVMLGAALATAGRVAILGEAVRSMGAVDAHDVDMHSEPKARLARHRTGLIQAPSGPRAR